MTIGTVKFFNEDKGYGFIQPDDGGKDSFVHISAVQAAGMATLNKDQRVSYEVETGQRQGIGRQSRQRELTRSIPGGSLYGSPGIPFPVPSRSRC